MAKTKYAGRLMPDPRDTASDTSSKSSELSTSEDDNEPSLHDLGPVDFVDFDWLLTDAVVKALDIGGQPLPRRDTPPPASPVAGPPVPKQVSDGDFKYVEFVPFWTDPDWDDDRTFMFRDPSGQKRASTAGPANPSTAASGTSSRAASRVAPGGMPLTRMDYRSNPQDPDSDEEGNQHRPLPVAKGSRPEDVRHIRKGDSGRHLRPALLGRDAHKNPTPYAHRFGIHPRGPGGRSRLSPTTSRTRRVLLSRPQMTATGFKDYIDIEDARIEERKYTEEAKNRGHDELSFREYLESVYASKTDQETEVYEAIHELRRVIDGDESFQRYLLKGYTTDERIEHRIHSVEDDFGISTDLSGPLHDLLDRTRWEDTAARGINWKEPRYMYNLMGRRGEYSAQEEEVWAAMQPGLQLATRVLNSNHPFWLALLNVYCRREVDPSRDKMNFRRRYARASMTSLWPTEFEPGMLNEAKALKKSGFNSMKAVSDYLAERLQITIGSARRNEGEAMAEGCAHWGRTWVLNHETPVDAVIMLELTAESIWPLLVPFFTAAEKATASFMLAVTVLHELAHAANYAMATCFRDAKANYHAIDQISSLSPADAMSLNKVWWELCRTYGGVEAYWMNEPRTELGFAFENQLFGFTVESGLSSSFRHFTNPIVLTADQWPLPNPNPHETTHLNILKNPRLPVDVHRMGVSVADNQKLFKSDFWDNHCVKYSHQGLKFEQSKPTLVWREYFRTKDLKRQFGVGAAEWMEDALNKLSRAGENIFKDYLQEATIDALGFVLVRKRWHHDAKAWSNRNKTFLALMDRIKDQEKKLSNVIAQAQTTDEDKAREIAVHNTGVQAAIATGQQPPEPGFLDMQSYVAGLQNNLESSFDHLVALYLECQRRALEFVKECQHMAVEYMRQTYADRHLLHERYGQYIHWQLENIYQESLQAYGKTVGDVGNALAAFVVQDEGRAHLASVVQEVQAKLQMVNNLAEEVKEYFTLYFTVQDEDLTGRFPTIVSAGYKSIRAALESVFLEELNHVTGPIKAVVIKYLELLDRHRRVRKGYEAPIEKEMEKRLQTHIAGSSVGKKEKGKRNPVDMFARLAREAGPPAQTGMGAAPDERFFRPPAPSLPEHLVPGPQFGAPSPLRSHPGTPGPLTPIAPVSGHPGFFKTQDSQTGFTQYASMQSPFSTIQGQSWMDNAQPQSFGKAAPLGGGPPMYQIFGTPTSAFNNVTEDLRRAGADPGELQNLFGGDVYFRQKLNGRNNQNP